MKDFQGTITTKLPNMGTSIFAVMSKLANEHNAINLSQGFPDFPISSKLIELVNYYMKKGFNQYAPMQGVPILRQIISNKVEKNYGIKYDPDKEINITAGATEAIYAAISSFVRDDDQVIIFEPAYDSYVPAILLNGGMVKYARLEYPDYRINWDEVPRLISQNTRMIIINTPHNPTGSILKHDDLVKLENLIRGRDIVVLSDEVYEHLIFDGNRHESICRYPELASRSFVIGSFGKTFHATGWKVGYVMAPENLMSEFRKAHQFIVFAVNTPVQYALAEFLSDDTNVAGLPQFYQKKRDYFLELMKNSRFNVIPSFGTYFQLLDYSRISEEGDMDFAVRLTKEFGIASIPVSPFYHKNLDNKVLRFCFAKENHTLEKAAEILCKI
jgi:methionine aminotransferase